MWEGNDGNVSGSPATSPGTWFSAGDVRSHPADEKRLEARPGGGVLVHGQGGTVNLFSTWSHGDVALHLEFMIPRGSSSGVYLMSRYEVQIYDSHGVTNPAHGFATRGDITRASAPDCDVRSRR